jgi:hypothetical protein
MIPPAVLALAVVAADPTLEEAQTCRAHMALFIAESAHDSGRVPGPSWFIRDWWVDRAIDAGAPEDDDAIIAARVEELRQLKTTAPDAFQRGRSACVQEAMAAGAVPE